MYYKMFITYTVSACSINYTGINNKEVIWCSEPCYKISLQFAIYFTRAQYSSVFSHKCGHTSSVKSSYKRTIMHSLVSSAAAALKICVTLPALSRNFTAFGHSQRSYHEPFFRRSLHSIQ